MFGCRECGAPLAHDQKYCLGCGARRGDLPSRVARLIASLDMPLPPAVAGVPPLLMPPPEDVAAGGIAAKVDAWVMDGDYPSPQFAAFAVMALLAFGVAMGSAVGPNLGPSPVYMLPTPAQTAAPAPTEAPAAAAGQTPMETVAGEPAPAAEAPAAPPGGAAAGKVNHVWVVVLSDQGYAKTFGDPSAKSYLASDLVPKGAVVPNYYAVAQGELANSIALISGQGPTWQILDNCPRYTDLSPGTVDAATGQALGDGCVFPESVSTIGEAVAATGRSWAAYVEDIDNGRNGRSTPCTVPAAGAADPDHETSADNAYASWGNPFAYFKSSAANCPFQVAGLKRLESDLASATSPPLSYVFPNRCHSGSDRPCAPGAPAGLGTTDGFLSSVVPKIMDSKDYKDGGLIAITFDQSPQGAADSDVSSCCGQPAYPNLAVPPAAQTAPTGATGASGGAGATADAGATGQTGPAGSTPNLFGYVPTTPAGEPAGGGKVGLLLISPLVKPGNADIVDDYNHYSLLLTIENWFGTAKLGYTAQMGISALPDSILNNAPAGATGATGGE